MNTVSKGVAWSLGALMCLSSSELYPQALRQSVIQTLDPTESRRGRAEPRSASGLPRYDTSSLRTDGDVEYTTLLTELVFTGVTVYEDRDLQGLWTHLAGTEISQLEAEALADAVVDMYRDDGYMVAFAIADTPDEEGVLAIHVIEGYVEAVVFEGGDVDRHPLLIKYAEKIMESVPLKARVLERYLNLMNDLPGLTIEGSFQAPPDPEGAETLIIEISYKPIDYLATLDNRGTSSVGTWLFSTGIRQNSVLLGSHDQAFVRLYTAFPDHEELRVVEIEANHPLGSEGATVSTGLTLSRVKPGGDLEEFDIESAYEEAFVSLTYPYIRLENESLWYFTRFDYTDSDSDAFGGELRFLDERASSLRFGLAYSRDNSWGGINSLTAEASQGLDILGASPSGNMLSSRSGGKNDYTKIYLSMLHWQPFSDEWSWLAAVEGQYAFDPLLSSEFISFGGEDSLRAYDESQLFGDHGAVLTLELGYAPFTELDIEPEWYGYLDMGKVWTRSTQVDPGDSDTASAAGIGLRFDLAAYLSGYAELGWPVKLPDDYDEGHGPNAFFGITARF